jgi:hypothetical protein
MFYFTVRKNLKQDFQRHLDLVSDLTFLESCLKTGESSKILRLLSKLFENLYSLGEKEYKKRNEIVTMMLSGSNKSFTFKIFNNITSQYILTKKLSENLIEILLQEDCLKESLREIIDAEVTNIKNREAFEIEKRRKEETEKRKKEEEMEQMNNLKKLMGGGGLF